MEEVSFALDPPEGEGELLHKGKQGKKTKFVPVTSCSDPARLEEGVNLCDLATLRAGENYLPSPSLKAKNKERATSFSSPVKTLAPQNTPYLAWIGLIPVASRQVGPCAIWPECKTGQDWGPRCRDNPDSSLLRQVWSSVQTQDPSTGLLVSDRGGRKTPSDTSLFTASTKSTQGGAGMRASALQRQTCNASYTASMHRAEPKATLSLLFKFPTFMHFFQTLMKDLVLRSKSLPEALHRGVKAAFWGWISLSPACSCCPTHFSALARNMGFCKLVLVQGRALETSENVLCSQVLPRQRLEVEWGWAQGNPASCKQPCLSPKCHIIWAFSSHAKQIGRRQGAPRHCFKVSPCQCNAGGRRNNTLYLQLCLPAALLALCASSSSPATKPATWPQPSPCCVTKQAKGTREKQTKPFRGRDCLALSFIRILNKPVPISTSLGPLFAYNHAVCKTMLQSSWVKSIRSRRSCRL